MEEPTAFKRLIHIPRDHLAETQRTMAMHSPERSVQIRQKDTQAVVRKHYKLKKKKQSYLIQRLETSSQFPTLIVGHLCVTDKETLDYGSGGGRREETPVWFNKGCSLDRKSFLKDQLWELCLQQWKSTPLEAEFGMMICNSAQLDS